MFDKKLKISSEGRKFIQHFESCSLQAYKDGKGYSIGFGHHGADVTEGMKINRVKALALFVKDVEWVEDAVNENVKVPLLQHEFDALADLVYNIGEPKFAGSTLLAYLNKGDRVEVGNQILRWNKHRGEVDPVLVKRRAADRALFIGFPYPTALKKGES